MNAMTWWDHETLSVWSQPWGRAISGQLKGTELELIPSQLVSWKTWRETHPDTLALRVEGQGSYRAEQSRSGYVIGVTLGEWAAAYPYDLVERVGLVHEEIGPYPVVVFVDAQTQAVAVYLRQVDDQVLTFGFDGLLVKDQETGSTWQMERGVAVDGPLQGQALRPVPYIPAYSSAWQDFYPHSQWYTGE